MRYAVTLSTFGAAAIHGTRRDLTGCTLTRARRLCTRHAQRGARRFGGAAPSLAATYRQAHGAYLSHAANARRRGNMAAAADYVQAARMIRLEMPDVERRELVRFGTPTRAGFISHETWGSRGGAFPMAYASAFVTVAR